MVGTVYQINQDFLSGLPKTPYRKGIGQYEGVVAHSTATPEATDEREVSFFKENWKKVQAFPHFFVDWDSITQIADTNYKCWASGNGNPRYAQVELCETKDHAKFLESYKRYCWLIAYLLKQRNLGVVSAQTLVSHKWVTENLGGTNHVDPIGYLASHGVTWSQFVGDVQSEYNYKPPQSYVCSHKVKKGENLTLIADAYKTTIERILKLNPNIKNPNTIYVGQIIRVPDNR